MLMMSHIKITLIQLNKWKCGIVMNSKEQIQVYVLIVDFSFPKVWIGTWSSDPEITLACAAP